MKHSLQPISDYVLMNKPCARSERMSPFPSEVVHGAIMVEPTETESKEELDQFIEAFKTIVNEARETPVLLYDAPKSCKVRRLDETTAARKPCLAG